MRLRIAIGAAGVLLGLFGVFRLLTQVSPSDLLMLAIWLAGALVLHDGIVSPIVAGTGWGMARVVPSRVRRYLQPALVVAAAITVIAIPLIYRRGSQPASKAILRQNYGGHLALVLAGIAVLAVLGYVIGVLRERRGSTGQRPSVTNSRPSTDQDSSTE